LKLLQELQRRNVFRAAIGYVVACWLIAQIADLVFEAIDAPGWVLQSVLLMLAPGFPLVIFFSWVYEVTPEAIKREAEIDERPAGHVILAGAHVDCLCGPMFDLDVTPNFKARLQEGGLDWPPETIIEPVTGK